MYCLANPGSYVAYALVRAASRLLAMHAWQPIELDDRPHAYDLRQCDILHVSATGAPLEVR